MMLTPDKVRPGKLTSAKPMSFLIPVGSSSEPFLVVPDQTGEPIAVFVGARFPFEGFPARAGENWSGLFVDDVRVEIDVSKVAPAYDVPRGGLVRQGSGLYVAVKMSGSGFGHVATLTVVDGLPLCDEEVAAAFPYWQIVTGEGREKQVIWSMPIATS